MIKRLRIIFVFLMVLIAFRFFDARFLNKHGINMIVYLFYAAAFILSLFHFSLKREGFVLPVQLIVISIITSIFMANQFWGQNIKNTLIVTIPFMTWIFFFYLLYIKISIGTIEKIILMYGVFYIILYFFQLAHPDTVLFGKSVGGWDQTDFSTNRGDIARIIFPGGGVFFLVVFMAINKLSSTARKKWMWITIAALGLIIPVLQVTRQFIFGVFVIYLYHFTKKLPVYKRVLFLVFSIGISIYLLNLNNSLVEGLTNVTEANLNKGSDYIRVRAGEFFLADFSPTVTNKVLGNGAPYSFSTYGQFISYLQRAYGYYRSDVGIIGMYAMFGILSVIGCIIIWVKSFTIPLPEEYSYLKYYLWFLLITSLTWYSVYQYNFLITTVFVLYLYHTISLRKEDNEEEV